MPRFDYKCPTCDRLDENVWVSVDATAPNHQRRCYVCGEEMEKLPSAPNFVMRGYSAKSGYSRKD